MGAENRDFEQMKQATAANAAAAPNGPAIPQQATEEWWRQYSGKSAPTYDPATGKGFDPTSVYDPMLADLDRQAALVKNGQATWSQERIDKQRADRLASPEYQREVDAARTAYNTARAGETDKAVSDFNKFASDTGAALKDVKGDPNDINRYYSEMDAPVQSQFYNAADQTAASLARQGLGNSGINVASSNQLAGNKAALETQARAKATDMAQQKQRQGLLDQFQMKANAMQTDLQNKGIDISSATASSIARMQTDTQLQMLKDQLDAQDTAGWMQLAGQVIGSGAGAAAMMCDIRTKDIASLREVGEFLPGVPMYEFEYIWMPGVKRYGPIAQELERLYPEMVVNDETGIKRVRL